ncbi:MAG TPA: NAD(P)/FAD-dependent oxidoreductase [Actinomycetota bacterium]|nr:NAD(P)/FAD-dependent oxidoreductase [Actinomycetota bacterium]
MDYDVVVIGAGAAGEAAGSLGGHLGARVAVVERDLVGGLCAFWACMPSKTLLDGAGRRHLGADYAWPRASDRRDWMISREGLDYPDDSGHIRALHDAGAEVVKGSARIVEAGRVEVRSDGGPPRTLEARSLVLSVGSQAVIPSIDGLEQAGYWTSNDGTALRELPSSILVLGGGAVGVELAQVYARFGVKTTLVQGGDRLLPRDHPRNGEVLQIQLEEEGVDVRTGVQAKSVRAGGPGRVVGLSDGSSVEAAQLLVAVGRRPSDLAALGAAEAGVELNDRGAATPDAQMRVGHGVFVAGDCAGGMQFTHVADYTGRIAVRAALGHQVRADLRSVPRTTFTDPETSAVGLTVEEAWYQGLDAFEVSQDFATTARGYTIEGSRGHITAVIDRERRTLVGAFAACPGASEMIHEAVLAIKRAIPVPVLADTIHAFPTAARVFGNVMAEATRQLG